MSITIEITLKDGSTKILKKILETKEDAKKYLVNFKGSSFIGYTDDGEFSIVVL